MAVKTPDYNGKNRRKLTIGEVIKVAGFFGSIIVFGILFWNNTNTGLASVKEKNKIQDIKIVEIDKCNHTQDIIIKGLETNILTIKDDVADIKTLLYRQYRKEDKL